MVCVDDTLQWLSCIIGRVGTRRSQEALFRCLCLCLFCCVWSAWPFMEFCGCKLKRAMLWAKNIRITAIKHRKGWNFDLTQKKNRWKMGKKNSRQVSLCFCDVLLHYWKSVKRHFIINAMNTEYTQVCLWQIKDIGFLAFCHIMSCANTAN